MDNTTDESKGDTADDFDLEMAPDEDLDEDLDEDDAGFDSDDEVLEDLLQSPDIGDLGCRMTIRPMLEAQSRLNQQFIGAAVAKLDTETVSDLLKGCSELVPSDNFVEPLRLSIIDTFKTHGWMAVAADESIVDYVAAVIDETTELLRSDQIWKFWKSPRPAPDVSNQLVELVDIAHFLMSYTMSCIFHLLYERKLQSLGMGETDTLPADDCAELEHSVFSATEKVIALGFEAAGERDPSDVSRALSVLSVQVFLKSLLVSRFDDDQSETSSVRQIELWKAFWEMLFNFGFKLSDLERLYVGKAALNEFRIMNNDQTGGYRRIWSDGREDNAHLADYVRAVKPDATLDRESVLAFLSSTYMQ